MSVATITAIGTVVGAVISGLVAIIVSQIQHNRTMAVVEFQLKELEKKVDKHNSLVERMYKVEAKLDIGERR